MMDEEVKRQQGLWISREVEPSYPNGYTMFTLLAASRDTFAQFVGELPFLELDGDDLLATNWVRTFLIRHADGGRMLQLAADFSAAEISDILIKADRHGLNPIAHAVGSGTARLGEARQKLGGGGLRIS